MTEYDLTFNPPVMNAAGSLGFAPDMHGPIDWSEFGGFITNPVSLMRRTAAHGTRYLDYPGGFLLHTGFPNPGLSQVLRQYSRLWKRSPVPVIIHILAQGAEEVSRMTRQLESVEGVGGLEIGFPNDVRVEVVTACTQAACGELPVIVQLPFERGAELAAKAIQAGAVKISLAAPRGSLPAQDGEPVQGRLYGPAVLPMTLRVVRELKELSIPIIGAGGIYTRKDVTAMLAAGATDVQLDAALWRGAGYRLLKEGEIDGDHGY